VSVLEIVGTYFNRLVTEIEIFLEREYLPRITSEKKLALLENLNGYHSEKKIKQYLESST